MRVSAGIRIVAVVGVALMATMMTNLPYALAIEPPTVDPGLVPPDGAPGPDQPMRQSNVCAQTIAAGLPDIAASSAGLPDIAAPSAGLRMLNVREAWQHSTGNGVTVAVIDTGVSPSRRLPVVPGGDYVMGGDGLADCDSHGTIVASLIAAAPDGSPKPAPMPLTPAFPPPAAGTPVTGARVPPPDPGTPPPNAPDGVVGVAPHATLISIRQSSRAYEPQHPVQGDFETRRKAGTIATLARAIVHAANQGAQVINVSVTACVSAADPLDQRSIGAAVWYAAMVKDAVIVAAAGNEGDDGCAQNPALTSLHTDDPRDWRNVKTVSSPSWFVDYVLSVGAVDGAGAPFPKSLAGPWVGVAAPGVGIVGLSPQSGRAVNAFAAPRPGERNPDIWGTSFAAAYVSGVAALVRAKFPKLTAHQVINRILQTAHNPPGGVDNRVGHGVVDAVAALTFTVPQSDPAPPGSRTRVVVLPAVPPPPDRRARSVALGLAGAVAASVLVGAAVARAKRSL